LPFLLLKIIKT